jgi:hypothetical protein
MKILTSKSAPNDCNQVFHGCGKLTSAHEERKKYNHDRRYTLIVFAFLFRVYAEYSRRIVLESLLHHNAEPAHAVASQEAIHSYSI